MRWFFLFRDIWRAVSHRHDWRENLTETGLWRRCHGCGKHQCYSKLHCRFIDADVNAMM